MPPAGPPARSLTGQRAGASAGIVGRQTDDDRRFRKARVHEIQEAIHAADALLKRIRLTCTRWGVTPRVAAH